jgi:alkylation response protein AidB-like acyl-CoA dehydrogenase
VQLTFDEDVEAFRAEFSEFLDKNLPTESETFQRPESVSHMPQWARNWQRLLFDNGWLLPAQPPEFGGRNATVLQQFVHLDELCRRRIFHSFNPQGVNIVAPSLITFGTTEQKRRWAVPLLRGEITASLGMSEPNAGSDLAALSTRAVRDGDEFVVNGQKVWTTNAMHGDKIFAMVRTEEGSQKHQGISMLLIDMNQPGVEARPLKQMSGASEFGEVFFTDARVKATDNIGGLGNGWNTAMLLLSFERGASGIGQYTAFRRQYDQIVATAKKFGRADDPVVRQELAKRLVELECLRYHSMHVLTEVEQGRDLGFEASMTKLQWSESSQDLWETFDDLLGPEATLRSPRPDLDLELLQQEAMWSRSVTIWGGSSQVQRTIVAERVLGLPR